MARRNLPDRDRSPGRFSAAPAGAALVLGTFVRSRRIAARLRQDELAALAGVGKRFVSDLEAGKPTVRLNAVEAVLAVFGKTLAIADRPRPAPVPEGVRT